MPSKKATKTTNEDPPARVYKAYTSSSSICSQVAQLAIIESGNTYETIDVDIDVQMDHLTEWYSKLNPKMSVPTVEHADCRTMTDSLDVICVLASEYKNANLLPNDTFIGLKKTM